MEEQLNPNEEVLFNLIETKDYDALSAHEKKVVLQCLTEAEFSKRREIVKNARFAFEPEEELLPLLVTTPKKTPLYRLPVPLYQVVMAAAAVALLFLLVPSHGSDGIRHEPQIIVQHDTVQVEKHITDTVIRIQEKKVIIEKPIYLVADERSYNTPSEQPVFDACQRFLLPAIEKSAMNNSGTSLRDESTAILIRDYLR